MPIGKIVEIYLLSFIQTADPTKVRIGERQRAEGEPKFSSHAEQGDSASGGHGVGIPQVSETAKIVAEDASPVQPRRQRKRKRLFLMLRLLAGAVLNPEVGVAALPTLPFITSSVFVTPEREDGDQTDFMAGANLRTITPPPRFVISSDSSHHSGANIAEAEADSFARPSVPLMTMTTIVTSTVDPTTTAKEKFAESSIFGGGSSSGAEHIVGGFSGLTGSDFIVGDDGRTRREMVDEFAPPKFFASIRGIKHDELFTEFNVGAARQISLSAEVRMRAEFNIREKRRLSEDLAATVKVREQEVADLDAVVTSVKVHNDNLSNQVRMFSLKFLSLVHNDNLSDQLEKFQDDRMRKMNEKFDKLDTDLVELALHLEERFYPLLLTTIFGRRWLLTHGLKLAIEGLSTGITHGVAGRVLTDVSAYNPSAEADYLSALQRLQSVNFSLITELKSNKDASIDTIMNLLRLEDSLAERLGLTESQPRMSPVPGFRGLEKILPTIGTDGQEAVNKSVPNDATGGNVNPFSQC
ncbi:hypothetical protein Tco_0920794 [Tanacetum coccineum]